jgi:hypothetical protein
MASTDGGQYSTAALQALRDVPGPGWIVTTWNRPESSLASAPAMPTTATGMFDTRNPHGCNKHVQSPKG